LGVSCDLAPDAAWVMKPDRENGSRIWKHLFEHEKHDLYEKKVVVVLNAHLTSIQPDSLARDESRFFTFVHDLIQIIDNTSASFAFVPFGRQMRWDDRAPNSWVAHKCKWHRKNFVLWDGSWSVQDTLDFIAAADAMISTRLHATIFACMGGTPFVDVTHHDKNRAFLRSVNLEDWSVPYWDFSRERSWSLLKNHLDQDYAHDFYKTFEGLASERCAALLSYAKGLKFISA
jgi:polysaccharide pyruvyl transferase WcaK-like protein